MFFAALTPVFEPTDAEVREALGVLGMTEGAVVCAYCGGKKSEWDHFRPITVDRKPTGFVTEIANLVPSCGKCNQSKGNKHWLEWIRGKAKHSPTTRGISDIDARVEHLSAYERWRKPIQVDYAALLGAADWDKHLRHLDEILAYMAAAEEHAAKCRQVISASLASKR